MIVDKDEFRRRLKRGIWSENVLVKFLNENGFNSMRLEGTSKKPIPDVFATQGNEIFAFELKTVSEGTMMAGRFYPKKQIIKLFDFLKMFSKYTDKERHAIIVLKYGKKWIFKEIFSVENPEIISIADRGNWKFMRKFTRSLQERRKK